MKERRPCEAEVHDPRCNGWANSIDHFTPKCIAKLWGWSKKQTEDPMNLQYLNEYCHRLKDKATPDMKRQLLEQMKGKFIGLGEHVG